MEGIAVYSAGQMGTSWYPSKEQVYGYIRNGDFMPTEFYGTDREERVRIAARPRTPFIYSEFACIVDFLVTKYGREKFLAYMKDLLDGGDPGKTFTRIFGAGFNEAIGDFRESVMRQTEGKS
jgi:hypothetical protein